MGCWHSTERAPPERQTPCSTDPLPAETLPAFRIIERCNYRHTSIVAGDLKRQTRGGMRSLVVCIGNAAMDHRDGKLVCTVLLFVDNKRAIRLQDSDSDVTDGQGYLVAKENCSSWRVELGLVPCLAEVERNLQLAHLGTVCEHPHPSQATNSSGAHSTHTRIELVLSELHALRHRDIARVEPTFLLLGDERTPETCIVGIQPRYSRLHEQKTYIKRHTSMGTPWPMREGSSNGRAL
jgi:hypothetical protein